MSERPQLTPLAKAAAILSFSILLGILFDYFFWGHIPGLSFPAYIAVVVGGLIALGAVFRRPPGRTVLGLLLPLGFFSAMVAVRASAPLSLLNLGASLMLLLLIAQLTTGRRLFKFKLSDYAKLALLPFRFLAPIGRTLSEVMALQRLYKNQPLAMQVAKGIALTLPLLIVFLLLFASADLVFAKHLAELFNIHLDRVTVIQTLLITFVAAGFTGAYAYAFAKAPAPTEVSILKLKPRVGRVESSILLGSLNALFFLFILVQLTYLFGGTHNISVEGFTYAEYARKGFFELIAVAVLSGLLLLTADRVVVKPGVAHSLAFRLLSAALIAQVMLIMVSAFKRLYLYEQAYGFTALRLYSHAFTILLAVIFVLLLIKILKNQSEQAFAFPVLIALIAFLVGLNLLNPDAFIARQNISRFHQTGKLDGAYLGGLSKDAHAEITTALAITTGETHADIEAALQERGISGSSDSSWQSWNYARHGK
jgi:hypothetical protein